MPNCTYDFAFENKNLTYYVGQPALTQALPYIAIDPVCQHHENLLINGAMGEPPPPFLRVGTSMLTVFTNDSFF